MRVAGKERKTMDKEILENIYDDDTQTVELEGEFGLAELEEIVKFLKEKE